MESGNRLVLITGGSSGIGKEMARIMATYGHQVVITSRDEDRARMAVKDLESRLSCPSDKGSVKAMVLDLGSTVSIHSFILEFKKQYKRLDILVNNAGGISTAFELNRDGIESSFASNHLGPLMLTLGLLPLLELTEVQHPSRVIFVASSAHWMASSKIRFDDEYLNNPATFSSWRTYQMVKLCNILATKALVSRLGSRSILVNCCHPGVVWTSLFGNQNPIVKLAIWPFSVSVEQGVVALLYLALSPSIADNKTRGEYFTRVRPISNSENLGMARPASVSSMAANSRLQEELWNYSIATLRRNLARHCLDREIDYFSAVE